ncbi:alpha-L-fucosidase [Prevotella denticola]|uniref:alpha-L-fucosidase n=1 Tax=Prevotella denticola TaxID=28129 RepID=UPI0005101DF0|nr:alpha-L-fucosidase [Prevotella denticola]KGF40960.1 alpha-L-fucosidase [Prevotella denticola DNF00960]
MKKTLLLIAALLTGFSSMAQETYKPTAENLKAREQFQDEKFGIFLHWGLYSMIGAGEWVMTNWNINHREYLKLAKTFYPSEFDADAWVSAIKAAGAKYITITTRHHDGFSLFKTATSTYNTVDGTPFKRDIIKELADACRRHGIKLHLYYSHLDWGREDYPQGRTGLGTGRDKEKADWNSYYHFMNTQLTELLTNYGPVGAIWFDGWWDHDSDAKPFDWQLTEQYAMIHRLQPQCLIGNNHHQTPNAGEDIQIFERDLPGENKAGLSGQRISRLPLESCQTINDHWGYSITDSNYKSPKQLIQMLVRAAGKNANLLLNIGPEPGGALPSLALDRLQAIGKWLNQYGETIYNTRGGIIAPHDWGVSTQRGNKLYIHILNCMDTSLFLPTGSHKVKSATIYGTNQRVNFTKTGHGITLNLNTVPTDIDYIVELTL